MHAPFLEVVAGGLVDAGWTVLRFNTRGTGASGGRFGGGAEELADLDAAWRYLGDAARALAGWSFGARLCMAHAATTAAPCVLFAPPLREAPGMPPLAKPAGPTLAVIGDRDSFVDAVAVEDFLGAAPVIFRGCDHFFIGRFAERAAEEAVAFFDRPGP